MLTIYSHNKASSTKGSELDSLRAPFISLQDIRLEQGRHALDKAAVYSKRSLIIKVVISHNEN